MKISVDWLAELTGLALEAEDLAHRLTAAGLEVDAVQPAAPLLAGILVGEIIAVEPHPDAEQLQVCAVKAASAEPIQIVCGAPNARVGLKAPLATVGAVLPDGTKIARAELRGVDSCGMLCSARELGLSDDAGGLLALSDECETGALLRDALVLDDHIIVLELTPNRSDCLGMYGLARECAALYGQRWEMPDTPAVAPQIELSKVIHLEAGDACPLYAGRVIQGVNAGAASPLWLQERLRRSGIRSISAIVDIASYVMLELGQPMHAFDLDRLHGDIRVRWARAGEAIQLLDESEVQLESRHLLICDERTPVALAGIMGGFDSAVTLQTENIFLESAWFSPAAIMGRARDLGMATDAAHRFERGVDPSLQRLAIERATALILSICGGQPGPLCSVENKAQLPQPLRIPLREARLAQLLGVNVPVDRVTAILHDLGTVMQRTDAGWLVTPPSGRLDLTREADLIEEVARLYGYDQIPARAPTGHLQPEPLPERLVNLARYRSCLCDNGYYEAITYSFIDQQLLQRFGWEQEAIALANPISQDMDVMRPSLVPGLVRAVQHNILHQQPRVRLYELGSSFDAAGAETQRLAAVCCGAVLPQQWGAAARSVDFYDCKGDLEALLALGAGAGLIRFEPVTQPWLHPGQSAAVYRGEECLGWIGALHPGLLRALDIEGQIYAFEMDLQRLRQRQLPSYRGYSRFPRIRRDLSLLVPEELSAEQLLRAINNQEGTVLRDVVIFDVYTGPGVEKGYKSLAMGLILQQDCSTLTDSDADAFVTRLLAELRAQLGVSLRG